MSMSRPRAPSASRSPISRVRSVTDTSMMFMIPIPPTSSDTAAMPASRKVIVVVVEVRMLDNSSMRPDAEVVVLVRRGAGGAARSSAAIRSRSPALVPPAAADTVIALHVGDAEQLLLRRRVGDVDRVVLVLAHRRPVPWLASTPTTRNGSLRIRIVWPTGSAPAPNRLSRTTVPSTATLAARATSDRSKNDAVGDHVHERIAGKSTSVPWIVVRQFRLPATTWARVLTCGPRSGRRARRAGSPARRRRSASWCCRAPERRAALRERCRPITMIRFVPARADLLLDRRPRAVADRDHRDHRGDADDHPERGQRRCAACCARAP